MAEPTSNLAPFYGDYVTDYLGKSQALSNLPFQPYTGDRFAGPSALQQQAFSGIGALSASPYFDQAAGVLGQAANMAKTGSGYTPTTFNAPGYTAQQISAPGAVGYDKVAGTSYTPQQLVQIQGIGGLLDASDMGTMKSFMNPYAQSVTDIALRRAQEAFGEQSSKRGAAAVAAGAFGGSRHGIIDALANRDFNQQLDDIQMRGGDAAYRAALEALNQQRGADLNRQQFNKNIEFNTGLQNAQMANQARQFGASNALQAALANQSAGINTGQFNANMLFNTGLQNAQMANQARQFNAGQNLTAQQLTDASRQFGAQNYNQGISSLLNAGTSLGNLGTAQTAANQNILNSQLNAGAIQQALAQQPLDFGYEQWRQSLQYPYQQLQFQQRMLQGLPLSVNQTAQPNALLEGLMGAGGIYNLLFGGRP